MKAGPSRPHPVPAEITIADRPVALLNWITENSGKKLEHLWQGLLPDEIDEEEKTGWYHDLHWLLNQGYVLLMADSTIHRAKKPEGDEPKRSSKKAARKKGKKDKGTSKKKKEAQPQTSDSPDASKASVLKRPPRSSGRRSGLYAANRRKLGGAAQEAVDLELRGLRARGSRSRPG